MIDVRAITTRGKLYDAAATRRELSRALSAAAEGARVDFRVTVQTWNKQPKFQIEGSQYSRRVFTTDEVYGYVDRGTKAHVIAPKAGKALVFRGGYKAKTRPKVIGSSGGGASGDVVFVGRPVMHPGTEPRKFTETIHAKWQKRFPELVSVAIAAGVR